jgi:hypothetical protein
MRRGIGLAADLAAWAMPRILCRIFVVLLFGCAVLVAGAQSSQTVGGVPPIDPTQGNSHFPGRAGIADSQLDATGQMRRMRLLNAARQRAMVSDADKLLALARELNGQMAAGGKSVSPADRMRMIAEIEKLAHSVKEKMSYVYAGNGEADPRNNLMNSWPQ